jgi:hypothetical protein
MAEVVESEEEEEEEEEEDDDDDDDDDDDMHTEASRGHGKLCQAVGSGGIHSLRFGAKGESVFVSAVEALCR